MPHVPQIAIVEFHNLVRRGLADLLSNSPAVQVVAVAQEPWQLDAEPPRCDVVLFGPAPPAEKALAESVATLAVHGRVLIVADFTGGQGVAEALRVGAYGCVTRETGDDDLLRAIETVAGGGLHVSAGLATRLQSELRRSAAPPQPLAPRETETLRWLAAGLTHGQIARRMDLTETTVSTYVKRIKNKLNVGNKADLTRKAIELGLALQDPQDYEPPDDPTQLPPAA